MAKKGKKEGKKRSRSGKSSPDTEVPPEKTNAFMLALRTESIKQSILHFRYEYTKMYLLLI
jgi:hypothetical protein